ncbi:MAG: hypothetical protein ACREID_03485, partial [Planctomycetota bacterium]
VRDGASPGAEAAERALLEAARESQEYPPLSHAVRRQALVLRDLREGKVPGDLGEADRYSAAIALWGIGARAGDAAKLASSLALLPFGDEEHAAIEAWLAHVKDPSRPRPGLPFEGMVR